MVTRVAGGLPLGNLGVNVQSYQANAYSPVSYGTNNVINLKASPNSAQNLPRPQAYGARSKSPNVGQHALPGGGRIVNF